MKKPAISKKKLKLIIIILALLLLIAAACYTVFIAPLLEKEEWIYKESTVERGNLTVGVTESGSLELGVSSILYNLDLTVDSSDDDDEDDEETDEETVYRYLEIEEVYATMGQRITEGDMLIKFSQASVTGVRKLLENALVDAKADYIEAQEEYNLALLEAQTTYNSQILEQSYAQANYNYVKESLALEKASLEKELVNCQEQVEELAEACEEAQESYNAALKAYNEAVEYYQGADIASTSNFMYAQTEYISAQTKYQNAQTALTQAISNQTSNTERIAEIQKELAQLEAFGAIELLEAEATYKEAVISGNNAEITYKATLESIESDLEEAESAKEEVEEKLAAFEAFVGEDGILYADGSGIVTQFSYSAGDSLVQAGTLVSYAKAEDMTITVDVTQEDIVDLSVGDSVEIVFTAYEGVVYEGSILSIDTTATSRSSNTVSYNVVIGVNGDTSKLYGGMVADITFVTEQKEDVLYVSKKAIVTENKKTYVYCDSLLGGKELVEVETGLSNGTYIEILSGLKEGDTVYIASRVSSEAEVNSTQTDEEGTAQSSNTGSDMTGGFEMPEGMEMPGNMGGDSSGQMPGNMGGDSSGQMPGNMGGSNSGQMPGNMGGNGRGQGRN